MNKVLSIFLFIGIGFLYVQEPIGMNSYTNESYTYLTENCGNSILGIIRNKKTKKVLSEVTVELWSPDEHIATVLTNHKGEFIFKNVVCDERYDIVSYKEGYYGFAEVQTTPQKDQKVFLYLDPEGPEEFEEEIIASSELTIIDTQTNKVIEETAPPIEYNNPSENNDLAVATTIPSQTTPVPKKLSFAEKRRLDALEKERQKKIRIREEIKRENEIGIARPKNRGLSFAERREYARLEEERQRRLRFQRELEVGSEVAGINIDNTKLSHAEKRELARIAKKKLKEESLKKEAAAKIKKKKEQEAAIQAILKKQKAAAEKERKERYAWARKEANKLKKEQEKIASIEKVKKDKHETAVKKTRAEKQRERALALKKRSKNV